MLSHYLKVALRNAVRHKGYALINILGLAIGMACCMLILLYVQDELSYDRHHENAPRLYRIAMNAQTADKLIESASTPAPLGPAVQRTYPEALQYTRIFPLFQKTLIQSGEKRFYEEHILVADASLFDVFTFPLAAGDATTALQDPHAVVITKAISEKYFGAEDPIGKTLTFWNNVAYRVTGVLEQIPANSHFTFDLLIPISTSTITYYQYENFLEEWWDWSCYNYVLLQEGASPAALQQKLPALIDRMAGDQFAASGLEVELFLQPVTDIHLYSHLERELGENSHIFYVYTFIAVALLILCISVMNFINLATARSVIRGKEVGVRKSVGANRRQLVRQFMGEALLLTTVASCLSLLLVELCLPAFNATVRKELAIPYDNPLYPGGLLALTVCLGLLSGSYPAFVLSSFHPIAALGGRLKAYATGALLKRILIVSQFAISIILLIATLIVYQQKTYFVNKALGFDKEQIVVIPLHDIRLRWESESIKQELLKLPEVSQATFSQTLPGLPKVSQGYAVRESDDIVTLNTVLTDHDFLSAFDLTLVAGRDFSRDLQTDRTAAFIINEAAARQLGWTDPLGRELKWGVTQKWGAVIGVVKDFHFESLHHPIEPMALHIEPNWYRNIAVKIRTQNLSDTLARLEAVWRQFSPDYPFDYFFLDDRIAMLYTKEDQLNTIVGGFSALAVFIACMGLFGMVSFVVARRTREIGVRKVLGASTPNILRLLTVDVVKPVVIANVIAYPVAYYALNNWLQNFAYRIDLGVTVFLAAGMLALLIALLTVGYHAVTAARANPADTLRCE